MDLVEAFIKAKKINRNYNLNKIEWDIDEINPGIYFLRIRNQNKIQTKKLVIQN